MTFLDLTTSPFLWAGIAIGAFAYFIFSRKTLWTLFWLAVAVLISLIGLEDVL